MCILSHSSQSFPNLRHELRVFPPNLFVGRYDSHQLSFKFLQKSIPGLSEVVFELFNSPFELSNAADVVDVLLQAEDELDQCLSVV